MEGWGENPERIEALIRDDVEVLAMWREAMKGHAGRPKTGSNPTILEKDRGKAYTVSRLQREAPDPRARGANANANPTPWSRFT